MTVTALAPRATAPFLAVCPQRRASYFGVPEKDADAMAIAGALGVSYGL